MNFAEFFAALAVAAEDPATFQAISDISTGEGGLAKVAKVASDLATVTNHVTSAIAAHPAAQS